LLLMVMIALSMPLMIAGYQEMPLDEYRLNIVVDEEDYTITGSEDIIYHNKGTTELNEVYFYLYPNAFKSEEIAPVENVEEVYPNGFDAGSIDVNVRGFEYEVENDIHLKVILDEPLYPGDFVTIHIDFEIDVPNMFYRFGYYDSLIYAANCFPIAAVNDNGEWALYPYLSRGDPFFSETANWKIDLMLKKEWVLATTGSVVKKYDNGEYFDYEIEAPMTRDYAFSCSPDYKVVQRDYEDIKIMSYYLEGHQKGGVQALDYAAEAIQLFEEVYGEYPYDTYTIAETHLGVGAGMEYPQLTFIDYNYYDISDEMIFQVIVVHETAHQWWYAMVGNDEYQDSFIDEALAQFSTALYYDELYQNKSEVYYNYFIFNTYKENIGDSVNIMDLALDEYVSDREYYLMVYIKGPVVLDMIMTYTGKEGFLEFLSGIQEEYRYGIIDKDILKNELDESFPDSLASTMLELFASTAEMPDARGGDSYYYEDGQYHIDIAYSNELEVPVEIKINYNDGTTETIGPITEYKGKNGGMIVSYDIDPLNKLIESDETNNIGNLELREEEDIKSYNYLYYAIPILAIICLVAYAYMKRYR